MIDTVTLPEGLLSAAVLVLGDRPDGGVHVSVKWLGKPADALAEEGDAPLSFRMMNHVFSESVAPILEAVKAEVGDEATTH